MSRSRSQRCPKFQHTLEEKSDIEPRAIEDSRRHTDVASAVADNSFPAKNIPAPFIPRRCRLQHARCCNRSRDSGVAGDERESSRVAICLKKERRCESYLFDKLRLQLLSLMLPMTLTIMRSLLFLFSFCAHSRAHSHSRARKYESPTVSRVNVGEHCEETSVKMYTRVSLHIRSYLFRLCLADQSIDEQACRLRTCLLLHACTLSIHDDLLYRDPFAMSAWMDSWCVPDFCYAQTRAFYESRGRVYRHRYAAFTRLNK